VGINEIKEEVVSRIILNYAATIHSSNIVLHNVLIGLSRKNTFLTDISDYGRNLNMDSFSRFLNKLIEEKSKGGKEREIVIEEDFEDIMSLSVEWIKNNVRKSKN
jgi:predicted transcriptional regulator YheO